ncbi:AAA family ATPase [Paractinoplanes brasiliensis]|uniref:AAA family ATPase n=1 Tax=Paractinoplanes brasiliensis TaxID=52695 RepID=UPI001FB6F00D|nr:AAA family ATPase [Actinoplanes brasiliensis]
MRASVGGAEVAFGSARRTAVLCVLALRAGRAVSREQLVAAVWGEEAPASATANVYTYVSSLRQALEPARDRWAAGQLLTSGGGIYQLHVPPEAVDVLRFEALREAAREQRAAGDPAAELAAVEAALALWGDGEPMAGVPGPFAAAQRLRLTELRLATADRHAVLLAGHTTASPLTAHIQPSLTTPAPTAHTQPSLTTPAPTAHTQPSLTTPAPTAHTQPSLTTPAPTAHTQPSLTTSAPTGPIQPGGTAEPPTTAARTGRRTAPTAATQFRPTATAQTNRTAAAPNSHAHPGPTTPPPTARTPSGLGPTSSLLAARTPPGPGPTSSLLAARYVSGPGPASALPAGTALPGGPALPHARRSPVPRQRLFLIGRTEQVRRLRHAAAEARAGRGVSVRVEGGPGSGKTVLVAAALDGFERIGWATGDELAQRTPLGVLIESATGVDDALAARLQELAENTDAAPPQKLAENTEAAPLQDVTDSIDAAGLREPPTDDDACGIVERAAALVREAAAEAPLILVADDLHWADPLTVRVWSALTAGIAQHPLLLVATTRQATGPQGEVVTLPPLDPAAATALIRATAPEPPEPRRLARILDDAGGNPHYLRHLAEDPTGASPAAAVGAHLASLPETTRATLRGVAFLGAYELTRPGPHPVAARVSELAVVTERDPDEVAAALAPARDAGLLRLDGDRAEFRHRVVARTLHEGTPGALRVALHRSFADRIAAAAGPPELVVAQLLAGEVPLDDNIAAWLSAEVEPLARRAPQIAVTMLQRVRAHHTLAPVRRLTLTAWLARLLLRGRRNAAAEAGWVAARTPDHDLAGEMRWIAARSHEQRGQFETAAEIARTALREPWITPLWAEALRTLLARVDTRLTRSRPALTGDRS